jgi:bifunctional oligoribonuclease and PAP phosphatase NrnA
MKNIEKQIIKLIDEAKSILIMPSSPPDGDSLGCAVAMYLALKKLGKTSTVVCADPVPEVFQFLPMINTISNEFTPTPDFIITVDTKGAEMETLHSKLEEDKINIILTAKGGKLSADQVSFSQGENKYDLMITVDTAALQQLGKFYEDNVSLFQDIPVINIDHHISNENFGLINHVDVMSSSATEIVLELFEAMEAEKGMDIIDEDIATLLLAGVITDTGSFQNANTNPRSFANSAKLIKRGGRQQEIIQHVFKTKQLSTLRLWGRVLSNIHIEKDFRFLWSVITKKDLAETGSKPDETGGIIDELMSNAPDTDIVVLLKEKDDGTLSGSMRTIVEGVDASEIAGFFGGGGHPKAAGFRIENSTFASAGKRVIDKIKEYQSKRLHIEPSQTVEEKATKATLDVPASVNNKTKIEEKTAESGNSTKPTKHIPKEVEEKLKTLKKDTKSPQEIKPGQMYHFEK